MKVGELMTREVGTCRRDQTLNIAAQIMWEHDCGSVPVVDSYGRVIAMITDRDICMAAYTQGKALSEIYVSTCASEDLVSVREEEEIETVEELMRQHQIRRVPVVDDRGRAVGILAMGDLAVNAHVSPAKGHELSSDSIAGTLAAVSEPSPIKNAA
ncbi:MAG: CBS domain-containing protein [Polyangiaceae bacterium]|nr:CBS domain-containing protein [Polyangiaceae bacterium]